VRVVRHHDDGFAVLTIERLEEVKDFVARLAVEVAGRLVAQQQGWVGDNGAGNARRAAVRRGKCVEGNASRAG